MAKKKKKSKITKQILGTILLSAIICFVIYIGYLIVDLIANPTNSFIIQKDVLTSEESLEGYVIRDEQVIDCTQYGNEIVKVKEEGKRVAKGETIFRYYTANEDEIKKEIEDIDKELQEALSGQTDLFPSDIKALDNKIEDTLREINNESSIQEIKELKETISNYILKKAKIAGELSPTGSYINNLTNQRTELEQTLYNATQYVSASTTGVISYRIDGLEEILTPNNFENLSEKSLKNLNLITGQKVVESDNQVKIINNFECYIAIYTKSEEAKKIEKEDKINIRVSNLEEQIAEVVYVKDDDDIRIIVLKINAGVENLINYRKVSVDVIWWEKEGLKAPKSAIIYENGLSYVVRKRYGNLNKILVKVEQENEKYCIIRNYKTSELKELGYSAEEINKLKNVDIYDEILVNPNLDEMD